MAFNRFWVSLIFVFVFSLLLSQPNYVSGHIQLNPILDEELPNPSPIDVPLIPESYKVFPSVHPAEREPFDSAKDASIELLLTAIPLDIRFPRTRFDTMSTEEHSPDGRVFRPRVVGGSEVNPPNSYPWVASLQFNGEHYCGGALIDPEWVLTAAHCWTDPDGDLYEISPFDTVILGEHSLSNASGREQAIGPDDVYLHPLWDYTSFEYDLALLHLGTLAVINEYVQPINILDTSASEDQAAIVAGWGAQYYTGPGSDLLMEGDLQILADSACSNYGSSYHPGSMLCAGVMSYSVDACQGDSGGPLFYHDGNSWVQTGVVSWGNGCAKEGFPGIYARTSLVPDWQFAMEYDCNAQGAIPASVNAGGKST